MIRIESNIDQVVRDLRRLQRQFPGAVARGINKAGEQGRTVLRSHIKQTLNLPAREINAGTGLRKAKRNDMNASLWTQGRPRSLRRYGAKVEGRRGRRKLRKARASDLGFQIRQFKGGAKRGPKQGSHWTGKPRNAPVFVSIRPGDRKEVRGAFMRNRDDAVFKREGKARKPLRFLFGPSIASAAKKPEVYRAVTDKVRSVVGRLIEHEITREIRRA